MAKFVQTTLIDGYAGGPHVTEAQLGLAHQATFGSDDYVLEGGRESEAQVLTNNSIRIFDAVYCIQGRRDVIPASGYTDVTIANGTQGMNRNDIIVRRYKKNESSEIESTEYAVIKGTPNAGMAVDPEVTIGDIRSGATLHEMALYRVKLTGLNITAVEPMFNILKNMATLQKEFTELNSNSIIKSGHNDNGYYRKYADGTLEMWGSKRFDNINMQTPDNWNYYCGGRVNVPLPKESKTWVSVIATAAGSCAPWISIPQNGLGTELFQAWIYSSSKSASETITIFWRCFGTWK